MPEILRELDEEYAGLEKQALWNERASTLIGNVEEVCKGMRQVAANNLPLIGSVREVLKLAIGMQERLRSGKDISGAEILELEKALVCLHEANKG